MKESETGWISVKDRLQENDDSVLVGWAGNVSIGWWDEFWRMDFSVKFLEVTHWRPLPLPPYTREEK